jgi:hypothetical protein
VPSGAPVAERPATPDAGIDANYYNHGGGRGRLELANTGTVDLIDVRFTLPPEAGSSFHVAAELPIAKLPVGKSVGFAAIRTMGGGATSFEIPVTARTPDGTAVELRAWVSLS